MIQIAAYKTSAGTTATFLFSPEENLLYRQESGEMQVMGRPENFVYPNVPQPQNMTTYAARRLTFFCKDWLERIGTNDGNN